MTLQVTTASGRRRWIVALVGASILMTVIMVQRATKRGSSDYPPTVEFGRALLLEGENVYATRPAGGTHNKYPPSFFLLTAPFALVPFTLGAVLWCALSVVLGVAGAWLAVAAVKPPGAGRPAFGEVLTPLLLAGPLIGTNLMLGQVNIIVVSFVAAALYLATRRRAVSSGIAVVIAVALKVTPALLVVGFAWKRGWRVLVGAALGLVLCFAVLPALVLGPTAAAQATRDWTRIVTGFVAEGAAAETNEGVNIGYRHTNQSLDAAAHRLLCAVPALKPKGSRPPLYVNIAALDPDAPALHILVKGGIFLLLLALLWLARGPLTETGRLALGLDVSLALIVILAIAPISWNSYFVALLVPFAVALEAIRRRPRGDRLRTWLQRAVTAAFLLIFVGLCPYARAYSVLLLAALILGAALAATRIAERRAPTDTTGIPA